MAERAAPSCRGARRAIEGNARAAPCQAREHGLARMKDRSLKRLVLESDRRMLSSCTYLLFLILGERSWAELKLRLALKSTELLRYRSVDCTTWSSLSYCLAYTRDCSTVLLRTTSVAGGVSSCLGHNSRNKCPSPAIQGENVLLYFIARSPNLPRSVLHMWEELFPMLVHSRHVCITVPVGWLVISLLGPSRCLFITKRAPVCRALTSGG